MRLQEMYFICKSALEQLPDYETTQTTIGSAKFYELKNWNAIDSILTELYQVKGLMPYIDRFRKTSKTLSQGAKLTFLTSGEQGAADNAYRNLITALDAVVSTYASFHIPDHAEGIDIKLPDHTSLEQLSEISKDMDTAFKQCTVLSKDNGSVSLVAMDVGSMWFSFVAIGTYTLNRIAAFIDKCLVIKSHIISLKAQREQAKRMAMGDTYIKDMMEMHKTFTHSVARTLAENLCAENDITDNEDIERARLSIELFGNLMAQGVEVYASIQASKDVQVLFPSIEQLAIPKQFIEALSEKNTAEPEDAINN